MPWPSGKDFAGKHNKKLRGHAADVAAAAATNALKEGHDEGAAVRIGNAAGDKAMAKKHPRHRPDGFYKKD